MLLASFKSLGTIDGRRELAAKALAAVAAGGLDADLTDVAGPVRLVVVQAAVAHEPLTLGAFREDRQRAAAVEVLHPFVHHLRLGDVGA